MLTVKRSHFMKMVHGDPLIKMVKVSKVPLYYNHDTGSTGCVELIVFTSRQCDQGPSLVGLGVLCE